MRLTRFRRGSEDFIQWVRDEYGVLAAGTSINRRSGDELQREFGHESATSDDVFQWQTLSAAPFKRWLGWVTEDGKHTPDDWVPTRTALRIWFARKGAYSKGAQYQYQLSIGTKTTGRSPDWWLDKLGEVDRLADIPFYASTSGRTQMVRVSSKAHCETFIEYIGDPVPGYGWK